MASPKKASAEKAPKKPTVLTGADRQKIASFVSNLNLSEYPLWWSPLGTLSNRTEFDGLEVFEDEIFLETGDSKTFRGNANVYVKLVYGSEADESWSSDSFPLRFVGHFDGAKIVIKDITVDTSSFHNSNESIDISGPASE